MSWNDQREFMSHRRWISARRARRASLFAGLGAVIAVTAACGGGTTPTGSSSPQSSTTAPSSTSAAPQTSTGSGQGSGQVTVSDEAAKQLCDLLRPQLSDWRVQGPTLGGIAYNATVHDWALRNGGINVQVLGDKDVVDRITKANCSDVRDQAIQALEIPNLATGLAF
ncbi:hypothetical protein ACWIGI_05315 [Nocardia sp. NPDC055321]